MKLNNLLMVFILISSVGIVSCVQHQEIVDIDKSYGLESLSRLPSAAMVTVDTTDSTDGMASADYFDKLNCKYSELKVEEIMKSEDPGHTFVCQFMGYTVANRFGALYLAQFDKELQQKHDSRAQLASKGKNDEFNLLKSKSYISILAAYSLQYEVFENIMSNYTDLLRINYTRPSDYFQIYRSSFLDEKAYQNAVNNSEFTYRYLVARGALQFVNDWLKQHTETADSAEEYQTLTDLKEAINVAQDEFNQHGKADLKNEPLQAFDVNEVINPKNKAHLEILKSSAQYLKGLNLSYYDFEKEKDAGLKQYASDSQNKVDKIFNAEIQKEANIIQAQTEKQLKEELAKRDPAGLQLYPSTGANGTVTGNTFPKNTWALTYDDGPSTAYTHLALDNVKANGIHTTFFWLAQNLQNTKTFQATVDRAKAEGHVLANHSWSHPNMPKFVNDNAKLKHEIVDSTNLDKSVYGFSPRFFRLPYGAGTKIEKIRKMIADLGMIHVFWNVDSLDWQDKNPASIVNRVKQQVSLQNPKHGGIILFHDIHPQSIAASKILMTWFAEQKFRMVTLAEAVDEINNGSGAAELTGITGAARPSTATAKHD